MLATTLLKSSVKRLTKLYIKRWGVETSFKRLKSYQNIGTIYARSHKLWLQELQVRILYDSLIIRRQVYYSRNKAYNVHNLIVYFYLLDIQYSLVAHSLYLIPLLKII